MNVDRREAAARGNLPSAHRSLTLSGALLLGGFVVNAIQRGLLHPSGAEDDHEAIFAEYAESDVWVATHFAEFVLVLVTFAGFLVLCQALWRDTPYLALLAAGTITVAAATWTALQAVDGITLKQSVDAWAAASRPEKSARYADAEIVRWIEWGLQSYLRVLLGIAFLLLGAASVVSRLIPSWLGVLLAVAGLLSLGVGISVGYAGLESGFQDALGIAFQLLVLAFVVGCSSSADEPESRAAAQPAPKDARRSAGRGCVQRLCPSSQTSPGVVRTPPGGLARA